jgi:protein O-GlcNAc transferase
MLKSLLKQVFKKIKPMPEREAGAQINPVISPQHATEGRLAAGMKCQSEGRLSEAEQIYRSVLADDPEQVDALFLLGHVLKLQNRPEEAVAVLGRLTVLAPQDPLARYSLATALFAQTRLTEAAQALREALRLKPDMLAALNNLTDILTALGQVDEAEECYQRILQLTPGSEEAHFKYGNFLVLLGRIDEAIANLRRAIEINPELMSAHSNLLFAMNYSADYSPEALFREHLEWDRRHAAPLSREASPHRNSRAAGRKLRIGYVSAHFRDHAVSYFFESTLKYHDYDRFEVFCYSDVIKPDAFTERMRAYPCVWRDIVNQGDAAVASLVESDGIDILVDLSGHTDVRLLVFARKPAPVQVTWNGYPNTTGMAAMDYRITDACADPPGMTEHLHTEKLVRLPEIYMAYQQLRASPPVAPPPSIGKGYVTFGSFNTLPKVGPQVIAVWARILSALPTARLMILTVPEGSTRTRLAQAFAAHGIGPERLEMIARLPSWQFMEAHQQVDIALDPFPYNGTTTTCQTLWMGVPLIALAGGTHVSRVGVSMLTSLGLQRLIARDHQEYVSLAVALAENRDELAALRAGLRERMQGSPLTDGARLTGFLEAAYTKMWDDYCLRAGI